MKKLIFSLICVAFLTMAPISIIASGEYKEECNQTIQPFYDQPSDKSTKK